MSQQRIWSALLVSCVGTVLGCKGLSKDAPTPQSGGQSGSEGSVSCSITTMPFETARLDGIRAADTLLEFEKALTASAPLALDWRPPLRGRQRIPLTSIEFSDIRYGDTLDAGCSRLSTNVELRARSADGQLDARFKGTLVSQSFDPRRSDRVDLHLDAALSEGGLSDGPAHSGVAADDVITLALHWFPVYSKQDPFSGNLSLANGPLIAAIAGSGAGPWEPTGPEDVRPFTPSVLLRDACQSVDATSPAMFDSDIEVRQALAKRWIVCSGKSNADPAFAGLEIDTDGHWHHLSVQDDKLVELGGFDHEGEIALNPFDKGNIAILDWLPNRFLFSRVSLSASGNTLRIEADDEYFVFDGTLQATDLPIGSIPVPYAKDTRAGLAACSQPEADVTSRPHSSTEVMELLVGRWAFCTGRFGTDHAGVVFASDGTYRYLDMNGQPSPSQQDPEGRFQIIDTSSANGPSSYQIDLISSDGKRPLTLSMPIFARTPLKLMANDDFQTLLSALPE